MDIYSGDVVIRQARPLHAGLVEGGSDLIGWENKTGLFTAFETKTPNGRLTERQKTFIDAVNAAGGIGRCIRNLAEIPSSSSLPTSDSMPNSEIV